MDPKAKKLKKARTMIQALNLIRQGCQKAHWAVSKIEEDTDVYLVGKPEMVVYIKELINETLRQEVPKVVQTGSLELGASSKNDSERTHAETLLQEEGTGEDRSKVSGGSDSHYNKDSQ